MALRLLYSGPSAEVLHREYAARGRVDRDAQLLSASSRVIGHPVERVWQALADLPAWPSWGANVRVTAFEGLRPGARFRWRLNGMPIRSRFAVVRPHRELTWTGTFLWFRAVDRHLLEPLGEDATRVTIEESLAGPLLPLCYSAARLRANHDRRLADLAAHLAATARREAGREPYPGG
jgi:Uncharacterized conserved protein